MENFISTLPEEIKSSIPAELVQDQSFSGFATIGDLMKGYVDKSKTQQAGDWSASLSDEHKSLLAVKGWKNPGDVIKSYGELEKMVGGEKIVLPKKDKDGNYAKGELERFLSAVGLPKDATGYKVNMPEGLSINGETLAAFLAKAHQQGLLPHQVQFMMDELAGIVKQGTDAQKENAEKAHNEAALNLRTKWGMSYDQNKSIANKVLQGFAPDKNKLADIVSRYGNDPILIELLANVGKGMSEDSLSAAGMRGQLLDPASADAEIKKIMSDKTSPYWNATHPDHKYWVNRMTELYKMKG